MHDEGHNCSQVILDGGRGSVLGWSAIQKLTIGDNYGNGAAG